MSWLRRLLGLDRVSTAAPEPVPPSPDLTAGKRRLRHHLNSADKAIQAAMAEADSTFGYHGPDRRQHPR